MLNRKLPIKERIAAVLMLVMLPLAFCLGELSMGAMPLALEKIQGLERYQGVCKQFRVAEDGGRGITYRIAYFDFDNNLTVRCIEGNWKDCALTEEQLSAAEGTVCEVLYTKAESFGGAHRLFGIKSDGKVLISEETMRKVFQKHTGIVLTVFSITLVVGLSVLFLTGQRKQSNEALHRRRERRRLRKKASYDRRKDRLQRNRMKER